MNYRFDADLAPYVAMLAAPDPEDLAGNRQLMDYVAGQLGDYPTARGVTAEDRLIDGPAGPASVPIRSYRPADGQPGRPVLIYLHLGGFTCGSVDILHPMSQRMADELDAVVVSVDYRLAPEAPFPAGLEDCYAALEWVAGHAAELGADPSRLAVVGDSSGGGLAAALALLARDRQGPAIALQVLGFAQLDDRLDTVSAREFTDTPMWTRHGAQVSWRHYLGAGRPGGPDVSQYAAPARAGELAGLPPAFISACEYDPFRDEDLAYGQRLVQAGVPVELHLYPGTFHACTAIEQAAVSRRMVADQLAALLRALHPADQQVAEQLPS
ncbi:MAG: alpha/beta hydrolase [Jatrophihabitans sp.]